MRIGLNLLYLIPNIVGGTQTYAVSLIESLARLDQDNEYFVFLNQESACLELADAPNFHRIVCQFRATRRITRYFWEQLVLPFQLRNYHLDLVHSLGYVGPLFTLCPSVVTIPDLNFIVLRNFIPAGRQRVLRFLSAQSAKRSVHVITISDFSKGEIVRLMGVPSERVTVTHLGPGWDTGYSNQGLDESIRLIYQLPDRYIVAFGGSSLHKNIPKLIAAFRNIADEISQSLVIVGHLPPNVDLATIQRGGDLSHRIVMTGYVPREHLRPILEQADLYVLPSLYEGFGLPVLEAQAAGAPVACANVASLPEVAGDGAIFFDPMSVDDIARAMCRVLSDENLRSSLRERGKQNVGRFSWDNTARGALEVYRKVTS